MTTPRLRIGTRASSLARWQANWVATQVAAQGAEVELVPITTRGDASSGERIDEFGGPGVFTKEIQRALLERRVDVAVHSLKDLPTDEVDGLLLAAVPKREDVRDVLICRGGQRLEDLPARSAIGTSSLRRRAQLLHVRSDLEMRDIRGNIDTRLEKLSAGRYDAIVLAYAGLKRLGLDSRIAQILEPDVLMPAVGQGALAIEARRDDRSTLEILARLDHPPTHRAVLAERALLAALQGGCLAPVGAWAQEKPGKRLLLQAVVLSGDGRKRIAAESSSDADPVPLGRAVAEALLAQGAAELIAQSRGSV